MQENLIWQKKKVWVVGHKHPDTDSICAAISYANLKNEIEKKCQNSWRDFRFRSGNRSSTWHGSDPCHD